MAQAQPNPFSAETCSLVQSSVEAYITSVGPFGSPAFSDELDGTAPPLATAPGPSQHIAELVVATTPDDIEPAGAAAHAAPEGGTSDRPSTAGGKRKRTSPTPAPPDDEESDDGLYYEWCLLGELERQRQRHEWERRRARATGAGAAGS